MTDAYENVEVPATDAQLDEIVELTLSEHPRPWGTVGGVMRDGKGKAIPKVTELIVQLALTAQDLRTKYDGTKWCTKCNERKPLAEFYKHPDGARSRNSQCVACCKKYARARQSKRRKAIKLDPS